MIKNLIVSGCSFTDNRYHHTWANFVADLLRPSVFVNLGRSSAGNTYISHSVIDCLARNAYVPTETLILIMWSGPDRHDLLVSGEYWHLVQNYTCKTDLSDPDGYWIFSGGRSNSWLDHVETRKLFGPHYTTVDPFVICTRSLLQMSLTSSHLNQLGYRHAFMSYVNYWNSDLSCQSVGHGDFNMSFFCQNLPIFQRMTFANWIFANDNKDTIYEFCRDRGLLSQDKFHPSMMAHKLYAEQVVVPYLERNVL
jgi:hypothetical protein